jgi:hypothetical protein
VRDTKADGGQTLVGYGWQAMLRAGEKVLAVRSFTEAGMMGSRLIG